MKISSVVFLTIQLLLIRTFLSRSKSGLSRLARPIFLMFVISLTACGGGGGSDDSSNLPPPGSGSEISKVAFSDPSLAECVQSTAAINGWSLLADVTSLDCSDANIRLLNGLQSFTSLETLSLRGNIVSDITLLSDLDNINVLDLSANSSVRNIDALLLLNNLTQVNLSESGSGDISCTSITALSLVAGSVNAPDICKQLISDIVFVDSALESCVGLTATQNSFLFTRDVTALECISAGITQLDGIESFQNLVSINIFGNQISDLTPLSQLTALEYLYAAENPITDVFALSQLPALIVLDLSGIPGLTNVDALAASTSLNELLLAGSGNGALECSTLDSLSAQLTTLNSPLACDMLISEVVFEDANLRNCVLNKANIGGITRTGELNNISDCTSMTITSLVGMEKFTNLEFVDFSGTGTTSLAPLSNLFKLRGINVNNNGIRDLNSLKLLTELRLIEARDNAFLEDVSAVLDMEFVKFFRLARSGTALFPAAGINCDILDQLQTDILSRQIGDPTSPPEFERPATCDNTIPPGFNADAISDMNGNGISDILLEKVGLSSWRIAISDPVNTQFIPETLFVETVSAKAIALADANNDTTDDLLVQLDNADGSRAWQVFNSNGNSLTKLGSPVSIIGLGIDDDARAVGFADINGDGDADILIQAQLASGVNYFVSFGTGVTYLPAELIYQFNPELGTPQIIALEDVNSDGTADFVFSRTTGNKHCFFVRTYVNGSFEEQSRNTECASTVISKDTKIEIVGVADITGNGLSELVIRKSNSQTHNWRSYSLTQGLSGTEWTTATRIITTDVVPGSSERTVALTDLDSDGRIDILNELTDGTTRSWIAYIAKDYGLFETQTWMTRDGSNVRAVDQEKSVGVRDYNGDGFPDLLIESSTQTVAQQLFVRIGDGVSFDSQAFNLWHFNIIDRENVIGVEEDGLTTVSNDTSALISRLGSTSGFTLNQLRTELGAEGLTLMTDDISVSLSNSVVAGECRIASSGKFADSDYGKDGGASFGALVCAVNVGDHVSITAQALHSKCQSNLLNPGSAPSDTGALKCQAGLFKAEVEVDLGGGVSHVIEAQGPNASFCSGSSSTGFCNHISGDIVSVSHKLKVSDGVEVGGGVGIGLSAGGSAGLEDGIFSASGELKLIGGIQVDIKLDLNPVISFGEDAFLFVEDASGIIILAAGEGIFGDIVGGAFGLAGSVITLGANLVEVYADQAVAVFGLGQDTAVAVFTGILTGDISLILDSLENLVTAPIDGVIAVITPVAGFIADGAVTIFEGIASIF